MSDVDSAGVYFLTLEEFEARSDAPEQGPKPVRGRPLQRFHAVWRRWKRRFFPSLYSGPPSPGR
jgi:hypothetical protein